MKLSRFDRRLLQWLKKRNGMASLDLIETMEHEFWFVRFRIYSHYLELQDLGLIRRTKQRDATGLVVFYYSLTTNGHKAIDKGYA